MDYDRSPAPTPEPDPPPPARKGLLLLVALAAALALVAALVVSRNNDRLLRETPPAGRSAAPASMAPATLAQPPPSDAVGAPTPAATGKLYKCKAPGGELSFLDQPCPDGHETVWVRDV